MSTEKRKICIVTSTRADWGLLSPLAHTLKDCEGVSLHIVATNMHLLDRYGHTIDEIVAEGFDIEDTVFMDDTDDEPYHKVLAMSDCMEGTAQAFADLNPDMLIILGDRYEMLAVAAAATVMRIPIVHIAGGEISEGAFDDNIRHAITKLSSLHLTATEPYRRRVIQMGENPECVINTGAIGVWNICNQPLMAIDALREAINFDVVPGRTLQVTFHPATRDTAETSARCEALLKALDQFPDYKVVFTYPNNDPGSEQIIKLLNAYATRSPERVLLVKSLGMVKYLSLLQFVAAVVGNSSSGIVEVPSLGVPTVDIGIRQKGRLAAESVIHCGDSEEEIADAIRLALSPEMQQLAQKRMNPYAKPDTLALMVESILNFDPAKHAAKKFYDL